MPDKFTKIGELLAAARKEQKKNLKDIAESTRIMVKYLEAIEAGNPEKLPSQPYFLLFSRSYAQFLGIDPSIIDGIDDSETAAVEEEEFSEAADGEKKETETRKQTKSFVKILVYLAVICIVLFAAVIAYNKWFVTGSENGGTGFLGLSTEQSPKDKADAQPLKIDYTPYEAPKDMVLDIRARQDVWVVIAKDGDTVLNRQLMAGETRHYEAKYRYLLTLGISTAVELTLNGTKLGPLTDRARTITGLEINQVNYKSFFAGPDTIQQSPAPRQTPPPAVTVPVSEATNNVPPDTAQRQPGLDETAGTEDKGDGN